MRLCEGVMKVEVTRLNKIKEPGFAEKGFAKTVRDSECGKLGCSNIHTEKCEHLLNDSVILQAYCNTVVTTSTEHGEVVRFAKCPDGEYLISDMPVSEGYFEPPEWEHRAAAKKLSRDVPQTTEEAW